MFNVRKQNKSHSIEHPVEDKGLSDPTPIKSAAVNVLREYPVHQHPNAPRVFRSVTLALGLACLPSRGARTLTLETDGGDEALDVGALGDGLALLLELAGDHVLPHVIVLQTKINHTKSKPTRQPNGVRIVSASERARAWQQTTLGDGIRGILGDNEGDRHDPSISPLDPTLSHGNDIFQTGQLHRQIIKPSHRHPCTHIPVKKITIKTENYSSKMNHF